MKAERIDSLGAGYQTAEKSEARVMAQAVERWLGNPFARSILRYCTKRCSKCGRRIDRILKAYLGEKEDLCDSCRLSAFIVTKILDSFINKSSVEKREVLENLSKPVWRKGLGSVLEGIAKYGIRKPFTSYSPFLVVWNYTNICNLRCKHCYEDSHNALPDELTPKQALKAVDIMAEAGIAYIALSGGEPLIRKDFFDLAQRILDNEMAFSIATNATLLTKEKAEKLKSMDCKYIQISLDGAIAKTHDNFRGRNVFKMTIQGIKNAVAAGVTTGIATTITQHNYNEVPKIIDLAEKLGVDIWMYYNFIPVGRGKEIINLDISPQQREKLLKMMAERTKTSPLNLLTTAPQYSMVCSAMESGVYSMTHFDTMSQELGSESIQFLAEFIGGCGTGRLYCGLEPNGDIEPCVFIREKVGNIMKDDIVDVWQNHPMFRAIRDREHFKGNCRSCSYRNICGGCRARALGYYGDITQSDPGCILNLKDWEKLKNNGEAIPR